MGLSGAVGRHLAGWAAHRPHLLLAAVPGATAVRLAVEAEAVRRGAVLVAAPADADVLVVAGRPGPEFAAAAGRVWAQLPGPRARVEVAEPADVPRRLAAAFDALAGADPDSRRAAGMDLPDDLGMAERAADRDGLRLDVLHVPLGPVLADWPAGLVVDLRLQGDVVQAAHARTLPPAAPAA